MFTKVSRTDFEWVYTEQPHASRRKIMLEKYPQIKQLFGHDPNFKWVVAGLVVTQLLTLPFIQHLSWPMLLLAAYCFGGVMNHSLMLSLHEISHNMAYGYARPMANRWFGFFANLPIGLPVSISFKKYHWEHHRYLAYDGIDADLPTLLEAKLFNTTCGKLMWVMLQPFFYCFRPLTVRPKPVELLEAVNLVIQLCFNAAVVHFFAWRTLCYLIIGSILTMGVHPVAGHFISEHYMFKKGYETYSYYGPLNFITFNVGYHMEHHDFPAIPASRLPEVKRIAPEFYDDLPQHTSWTAVLYDFVMDPDIGPYARIKRKEHGLET